MKSLTNKNIIITGAASGIGREMAGLLAKEKSNLAIIDIDRENLLKTENWLNQNQGSVKSYYCDLADYEAIDDTVETIISHFGHIDMLINNAGIFLGNTVEDSTFDDIQKTMTINFFAPVRMIKNILPKMIEKNNGHIVNVASVAGLIGGPRLSDYSASKHALLGYSDSLRMEMQKFGYNGIKISCLCPGYVDTGIVEGVKTTPSFPLLQPEYVAKKFINAIKKEKTYLKIPFSAKQAPLFKFFPASVGDWLSKVSGFSNSLDNFTGRNPNVAKAESAAASRRQG